MKNDKITNILLASPCKLDKNCAL